MTPPYSGCACFAYSGCAGFALTFRFDRLLRLLRGTSTTLAERLALRIQAPTTTHRGPLAARRRHTDVVMVVALRSSDVVRLR